MSGHAAQKCAAPRFSTEKAAVQLHGGFFCREEYYASMERRNQICFA